MNISRRWLEAFLLRPLDSDDASRRLGALGAAVDAVEPIHQGLEGILVAVVESVRQHPNADRLRVCEVNDGSGTLRQVVCGAPNVTAGKRYPFAPVGSSVPVGKGGGPMRIERAKLRGEQSEGMLCSTRELGVGTDADGIWELDLDVPAGTPLLQALPLDDERLVVDVTPNRPDLLCHKGVARELASSLGVPFRLPVIPSSHDARLPTPDSRLTSHDSTKAHGATEGRTAGVTIRIEDAAGCRRFHAAVIRDVRVGPSPAWLRQRLEAAGVRSISNIVDVTNYVMLELNQPMHAYDLALVQGPELVVKRASHGSRLTTLDGTERSLVTDMTVIADAARVVGVAGVMGGASTEVSSATTDVLLEAAYWTPAGIRRTRRALGLSSEASYRFERGIDLWGGAAAMRRAIELVLATAGGSLVDAPLDVWPEVTHPPRIFLRLARVAQVVGLDLDQFEVERCLVAIGATVVAKPGDGRLAVDVPGWRPDLREEIDLVEEVARIHGYDRIPTELRPFRVGSLPEAPAAVAERRVREGLLRLGLAEVVSLPFGPPDDGEVALVNPLADTGAHLRARLLPALVRHAEHNWNNQVKDVRLFEVGTVFRAAGPGARPYEAMHLGAVITGQREPAHWSGAQAPVDFWDLKALAEQVLALAHPGATWHVEGRSLRAEAPGGRVVGWAGSLDADAPPWAGPLYGVEVDVSVAIPDPVRVVALPTTPASARDISLVVPDGMASTSVLQVVREAAGPLLESVAVVGEFRGEAVGAGQRSLTLRLEFRAPDRTLRDAEVEGAEATLLAGLEARLGLRRRGAAAPA